MTEAEAARALARFIALLRRRGLEVTTQSALLYAEALAAVGLAERHLVYWAGRACLVSSPDDVAAYDEAFAAFFERGTLADPEDVPPSLLRHDGGEEEEGGDGRHDGLSALSWSARERLLEKDFARYDADDWSEANRLISLMRARPPRRRSRRMRPGRGGGTVDLPRTLRRALRSDGEAVVLSLSRPALTRRRIILLIDISGSMSPYVRAFLRFAHAGVVSRPAGDIEVFSLATRVTRLTRALRPRDPDLALATAAVSADDWFGGTRLGEGLRSFNDRFAVPGLARGAVVVILSDGWDRGDPGSVAEEMGRLSRVAHRIVWGNPLRASPGYEPLARAMAAALPYVDDFVGAHSLASLEELAHLLAAPRDRTRPLGSTLALRTRREAPCG